MAKRATAGDDGAPTPAPRQRLDAEARRAQLIGIGLELIKTTPLDQIVLDEVIERAGISTGLLFHYFPSKRDYQLAVVETAATGLLAALEPDRSLDVVSQLHAGIEAFVDYIEEYPIAYLALTRSAGSDVEIVAVIDRIREAIAELVAEPVLPYADDRLRLAIRGWIANAEECALIWIRDRPFERGVLVDLLMRGGMHLFALLDELQAEAPGPSGR